MYVPERGDLVWLCDPPAGHRHARRRPALVLTPHSYNGKVGLALCCPVTSQVKGYPFEVRLPDGLSITGAILADRVRSLDWRARQAQFIARLPESDLTAVLHKLEALLR
jgi:mRNA interferase MazF